MYAKKIDWLLTISRVCVGSAMVADTATSWGLYETNPVLGRGQFGLRQAAVKTSLYGGGMAASMVVGKRHRNMQVWGNFAVCGGLGAASVSNAHLRK